MPVEKPYNGGEWTTARMRSFIMSALRRAMWPVKYRAIRDSYVEDGVNPKTGRKCRLHRCSECGEVFPQNQMQADHIEPVVPLDGFDNKVWLEYDWNELLQRLYCEADGLQAVCKTCHKEKSLEERRVRNEHRRNAKII